MLFYNNFTEIYCMSTGSKNRPARSIKEQSLIERKADFSLKLGSEKYSRVFGLGSANSDSQHIFLEVTVIGSTVELNLVPIEHTLKTQDFSR